MKKFFFSLMVCLFAFQNGYAQRTVSGKVTDDTGESLPGVNVVIKGTTTGVTTDLDGNFRLEVDENTILVFSFVGFESQEITVGDRTTIDVTMGGATELQEVVVVGYGEVDKRKLISSVSSVDGSTLADMPVVSFDQALQGKAAGVQVTTTSGVLGSTPKVRIRGVNSITSGTSPLYVVDGVPIQTGELSGFLAGQLNGLADLNPSDIESYEILKDGAATAIYGSRASNGVILITTKKGSKSGQPQVDYSFTYGVNQTANRFDLLNAEEFVLISNEKFASAGITPQAFAGPDNVDTDWQDVIYRTGSVINHNLSLSGGSERVSYYFSAGMSDQEGAIKNNSLSRYSTRANIDYTANDWLKTGVKLQVSRQQSNGLNVSSSGLSGNVANATRLFPNVPVFEAEHPTGYNITPDNNALGRGNNLQNIAFNLTNIQYVLDKNIQETINTRFLGNGYLQIDLPYGI
ncbi:MAG: SusC/RagA family TonB-linked outer membrane protein, partial [Ekhidna sp.]|nr:SusC/RagA family TonB-linked outer membrane protein [Ekhidna sp.]